VNEVFGVVKLAGCGHVFCRRDVIEWVDSAHGSCPACRDTFFHFSQLSESDYESSDGGEYIPDEDEEPDDVELTDDGDLALSSDRDYWERDTDYADMEDGEDEGLRSVDEFIANYTPMPNRNQRVDEPTEEIAQEQELLSSDIDVDIDEDEERYEESDSYESESTNVGLSDGSDSLSSDISQAYNEQDDEDGVPEFVVDVSMFSMDELNDDDDPDYVPPDDELLSDDNKLYHSGYSSGIEGGDEEDIEL